MECDTIKVIVVCFKKNNDTEIKWKKFTVITIFMSKILVVNKTSLIS